MCSVAAGSITVAVARKGRLLALLQRRAQRRRQLEHLPQPDHLVGEVRGATGGRGGGRAQRPVVLVGVEVKREGREDR